MQESSDLTIVAEGKEIFVHRTVLRLRSDYFRAMLQEHWADETQKYVNKKFSFLRINCLNIVNSQNILALII